MRNPLYKSRQAEWQQRQQSLNLCTICAAALDPRTSYFCTTHHEARLLRQRIKRAALKFNKSK